MGTDGFHFTTPLRFFWYGEADVLFFFIHSGFILSYTYTQKNWPVGPRSYLRFLVERIFRIYPLFLVILLISFLAFQVTPAYQPASPDGWVQKFWYSETDFNNLLSQSMLVVRSPESANLRLIPQDWTLTVELIAGAGIPLLAFSGKRHLGFFVLLLGILKFSNILTTWIFEFGVGVFIFLVRKEISDIWKSSPAIIRYAIPVLAILTYTGFFIFPSLFTTDTLFVNSIAGRVIVDLGCFFFFIWMLNGVRIQRWLSQPWLVHIGRTCFSIYLLHKLLLLIAWRIWPGFFNALAAGSVIKTVLVYLVYLVLVCLLSILFFRMVEVPLNKFGKRIARVMTGQRIISN
jgi:peptidoglycan/LPS O-acetylase OafA/YrhL